MPIPLVLYIAYLLGAPPELARTAAAELGDRQDAPEMLARVLVWAEHESLYGAALSGHRWDSQAYGVLQIRHRPDLERDVDGSVRYWLWLLDDGTRRCGSLTGGLRMVSSGRCDKATVLVGQREAEADAVVAWAMASAASPVW